MVSRINTPAPAPAAPHEEQRPQPTDATLDDFVCPLCESPMQNLHCKLICRQCGYREDCSDIFPV